MRRSREFALLLVTLCSASFARAQEPIPLPPDWAVECTDPKNLTPASADYTFNDLINDLFYVNAGRSGTYTLGGPDPTSPCFSPNVGAQTIPIAGKYAFSYGPG